jgi:hypothetical protein
MASRPGEQVDPDDTLDEGVAARFYTDIQDALSFQIVIMETRIPPDGLEAYSVDVPFTKTSLGRYGFFGARKPEPGSPTASD